MTRRPLFLAPLLLAAAALAAPAPAAADVPVEFEIVTARNLFVPSEATITQGGSLVLTNVDLERHDVTALDWIGGRPLFQSSVIGPGQRAAVVGVTKLEPSVYPFYCSVHEEMRGNLTVL